jgi:hypothetical protein
LGGGWKVMGLGFPITITIPPLGIMALSPVVN